MEFASPLKKTGMKKVLRDHHYDPVRNIETYELKFKDKVDQSGFRITSLDDEPMQVMEIRIIKVPKKTNYIRIELVRKRKKNGVEKRFGDFYIPAI